MGPVDIRETVVNHDNTAVSIKDMVLEHDRQIDEIQRWKSELHGAFQLLRLALGTSIIAAIVSIVTLLAVLSGQVT